MSDTGPTWESYRRLEDSISKMDDDISKMEDDLGEKHVDNVTRLVRIETVLEDMTNKLFGNGQPGLVTRHEERISKLEALAIKIGAIAGVLILLVEVLHEVPIKELLGLGGK